MAEIRIKVEDLWDQRYLDTGGDYVVEGDFLSNGGVTVTNDGFAPKQEVNKTSTFTLRPDDNGKRFVVTAGITVVMPAIGVCGNGFEVEILNDSGGNITIDGPGATNVTVADGEMARVVEANSKQRVWKNATTSIADVFVVASDWDPGTVFGKDLDLAHWWDATRGISLDVVTGAVSKWDDSIALDNTAHLTKEGYQGLNNTAGRQPTWVASNEVRFNGSGIQLTVKTQSRNGWESRWFAMLFRVNWTAMASSTDSFLFSINGFDTSKNGNEQPRLNFIHSTHEVEAMWWTNESASFGKRSVKVTVPGADDTWHSLVARRNEDAIYLSIDGAAEVTLACYPRAFLDSGSSPTGLIGSKTGIVTNWGLDTLLQGQGTMTNSERAKLHGWMMHRRGAQANLDPGNPYVVDVPQMTAPEVHVPRADSYSKGYRFPPIGSPATVGWDDTVKGNALSLTGATRVFHDHFTSISTITDGLIGTGPNWWAPAHIDTSNAKFRKPLQTVADTYTILPDATTLQIKMQQVGGTGPFYSGHIQTVDCWANGNTFACPVGGYVYFEGRLALNDAAGWPAFWLYNQHAFKDSSVTNAEIDILEAYGDNVTSQKQHHATCFTHPAYRQQIGNIHDGTASRSPSKTTDVTLAPFSSPKLFDGTGAGSPGTFHTYGLKIDATWMTWYFDSKAISRFPTYSEALDDLFMLISLQSQDGTIPTVQTYLWVDYVDVWTHA
jgi:hypothetical protein